MVYMDSATLPITFTLKDWNTYRNKKIGKAVLESKSISTEGSFVQLSLGDGKGTLLIYARLYQDIVKDEKNSRLALENWSLNPLRVCLDHEFDNICEPNRPFRGGFLWCLSQRRNLRDLQFEIVVDYKGRAPGSGVTQQARKWTVDLRNNGELKVGEPPSSEASAAASINDFPFLAPGLHFFPFEFLYPSTDSNGFPIGSMSAQDLSATLKMTYTVEFWGTHQVERPIELRSDYPKYLKPSLPPSYDRYGTASARWPSGVKVIWSAPPEGINRSSPLPSHLFNPQELSDADKLWFLKDGDTKDAHGEERIYAHFFWHHPPRFPSDHRWHNEYYIILGNHEIDATAVESEIMDSVGGEKLTYGLALVNTYLEDNGARSYYSYILRETGHNVGAGKVEYSLPELNHLCAGQVCSVPHQMFGGLKESYTYIEVFAFVGSYEKAWTIKQYPIFIEQTTPLFDEIPGRNFESVQTMEANGSLRVGYNYFPFIDQTHGDEAALSVNPTSPFGPDRLVRLMSHSTKRDGTIAGGPCLHYTHTLTDALLMPSEWSQLDRPTLGPQSYSSHSFEGGAKVNGHETCLVQDPFMIPPPNDPRWSEAQAALNRILALKK